MGTPDLKPHSRDVTDGLERAAARGMLRAVGMDDDDFAKPQIGIASSWNEITPCNLSLDRLAKASKKGVAAAGGFPMEFGTISVSDGISMGHIGMHYSLVSREVIADSVETVMMAERFDGAVLLAGCDKSLPGMLMAAARLDVASVFLYAGSIMPGSVDGREVTIIDAFEAVGACARGLISREEVDRIERAICPGEGACGGMYTANTMACAAEALGMALPGSSSPPAVDRRRDGFAEASGAAVVEMISRGHTARSVLTREAFENAIAVVMALGGSTNAVLHLLAIANEARVPLELDDFNPIGDRVPHLADVKPFGAHVMSTVDRVGGVPVVMKALLDAGLLHGDALTVTGRTLAENLDELAPPELDGEVLHRLSDPIHPTGGLTILRGSARTSCCSPTGGSPAGRRACASGTSRPRPRTAGRSRWSATGTGSCSTSRRARWTCSSTTTSWPAAAPSGRRASPSCAPECCASTRRSSALRLRVRSAESLVTVGRSCATVPRWC